MKLKCSVSRGEGGRLLPFLRSHSPAEVSMKALKRLIDGKQCAVNGRIVRLSSCPLSPGDVVELELQQSPPPPVATLYEDEHLLICDKPAGLVCEATTFLPLELVHRLDKETSGVLILAKNRQTKEIMVALFEKRGIKKQYLALVDGVVDKERGEIKSFLQRSIIAGGQVRCRSVSKGGMVSLTRWQCLQRGKKASLLSLTPLTGRTHQLRVHCMEMGHPILGDLIYARPDAFRCSYPARRHLLHAESIRFSHPWTHKELEVRSSLSPDFCEAMRALGFTH